MIPDREHGSLPPPQRSHSRVPNRTLAADGPHGLRARADASARVTFARLRVLARSAPPLSSWPRRALARLRELFKTHGLALAAAIVMLLIVGNSRLAYQAVVALQDRGRDVSQTHTAIGQIALVRSTLDNAAASERSYILTGQNTYLQRYDLAHTQVDVEVAGLQMLTADQPVQQRVGPLERAMATMFDDFQGTINLRQATITHQALVAILADEDQAVGDVIGIIDDMDRAERALLAQRAAEVSATVNQAALTFAFSAIADVLLLGGIFLLIRRALIQRDRVAAERALLLANEQMARAEATERASQLQAIFEAMADAIFIYDPAAHIARANQAVNALLGIGEHVDFLSRPVEERTRLIELRDEHGQLLANDQWPATRLLSGETLTGANALNYLIRTLDGHERALSVTGAPMRDASGQIVGAVAVYRDITERRRLEQRTRDALAALLALAETLVRPPERNAATEQPSSLDARPTEQRIVDLARTVLGCQCAGLVGVTAETGVLEPVASVGLAPESAAAWQEHVRRHLLDEYLPPDLLARLRSGEGIVSVLGAPVPPPPPGSTPPSVLVAPLLIGDQLLGLLWFHFGSAQHPYTQDEVALAGAVAKLAALALERERLLRERSDAQARELALRETNARLHTFLGVAGHELRTPLTSLYMAVQLAGRALRDRQDAAAPEPSEAPRTRAQHLIDTAETQTARLARLIDNLLDISRVQAGMLDLRLAVGDLCALAREVVTMERLAWPERIVELEVPDDATVQVEMDQDRIGQVITNYLTNALKYAPADRPIAVHVARQGSTARVAVRDAGPGLTPEAQQRIWEPYQQAYDVAQQPGSRVGLGLGLYICRTIVERHGGQVGVESAPGQGSTFWFELPAPRD
jgi:PAS domain S-box-containing protein